MQPRQLVSVVRKPGSHMSPMIGESLSVTIQGAQMILLMSSHKQWSSPMSATYENRALKPGFHLS